jgi:hypothetical protein
MVAAMVVVTMLVVLQDHPTNYWDPGAGVPVTFVAMVQHSATEL